jgi:hypothetical protein
MSMCRSAIHRRLEIVEHRHDVLHLGPVNRLRSRASQFLARSTMNVSPPRGREYSTPAEAATDI